MKLEKIKSMDDVQLKGIRFEADMVGVEFRRIRATDEDGGMLEFQAVGSYDKEIAVFRKAPPEKVKRYRVSLELAGDKIERVFEKSYDAEVFKNKLIEDGLNCLLEEIEVLE